MEQEEEEEEDNTRSNKRSNSHIITTFPVLPMLTLMGTTKQTHEIRRMCLRSRHSKDAPEKHFYIEL